MIFFREEEEEEEVLLLMVVKNNHHLKRSDLSELSLFRETFVFNVFSSFKIRLHLLKRSNVSDSIKFSLSLLALYNKSCFKKRERERRERRERRGEGRSPSRSLVLGIIIL